MDHAARAASRGNATFLDSLPSDKEIEGDVKFVFVGQPLHDKYPAWLSDKFENIEILDLPVIEKEDVLLLLEYNDIRLKGVNLNSLAESIINVVGNNALNVFFAIYEFKALYNDAMTFDDFIVALRGKNLDGQIEKYYDWIFSSVSDSFIIKKISILFAFLSKKVTSEDIALLLDIKECELKYYLDKLYPLIQCDDNGYFCYHNDVRLFFADKTLCNGYSSAVIKSFFNITNNNDKLREIGYYFLFDALSTLEDKSFLYELYTSHYIIKSLQYAIPIELIEYQLISLFNDFHENRRIDKTIEICSVVKTYYQLVNCVQWNGKENLFFDKTKKLTSEKYILKNDEEIEQIINDIYNLMQNNLLERGNALFKEYLSEYSLKDYFNFFIDKHYKGDAIKKLGAIYREFNRDILLSADVEESSLYADFVSGWLEQSYKKEGAEELKYTLSFKSFYPKDLFNYVKSDISHFDLLSLEYLQKFEAGNSLFSILIEICVEKKLRNCYDKKLIEYLRKHSKDILTDNIFDFEYDRIPYYFKLLFCIYETSDEKSEKELYDLYINIINRTHISEKDRGFKPALKLYDCAKSLFIFYQKGQNPFKNLQEIIATLIYFENYYGAGSAHDCNTFEVKRFLFQIVIASIKKENNGELINKMCESLARHAFMGQKPKYYSELIELFYIINETKDLALQIFEFWAGDNGNVWNSEYTNIEYVCGDIVSWLIKGKDFEQAKKIDNRKKLKLIGYVGRKDYSMFDVLDWYKLLPDSQEKFIEGIKLLSISDYASEIGDNRISNYIDEALFDTAINLGPYYVDCLFNIKNTPDNFYYWREIFISEYLKYIETNVLPDKELIALYSIINAWIKPEIEKTRRYHHSSSDYINKTRYTIVSKIKDGSLRDKLLIDISYDRKETEEQQIVAEYDIDESMDVVLAPYYQIHIGDIVCMKAAGKPIDSIFIAGETQFYENSSYVFNEIKDKYANEICAHDDSFWETRKDKKYISLISIKQVMQLSKPFNVPKKDKRAWIKIEFMSPQNIILIAGKIGSGKTYWSDRIAEHFNCARASFSSYIKYICTLRAIECTRQNMQCIGAEVIENQLDQYIKYTVSYNIKNNNNIVIDGLRHEAVCNRMKELYPEANIVLIYVECEEDQRKKNIAIRGEDLGKADDDQMEIGAISLREKAHYILQYSDALSTAMERIAHLFYSSSLFDLY